MPLNTLEVPLKCLYPTLFGLWRPPENEIVSYPSNFDQLLAIHRTGHIMYTMSRYPVRWGSISKSNLALGVYSGSPVILHYKEKMRYYSRRRGLACLAAHVSQCKKKWKTKRIQSLRRGCYNTEPWGAFYGMFLMIGPHNDLQLDRGTALHLNKTQTPCWR